MLLVAPATVVAMDTHFHAIPLFQLKHYLLRLLVSAIKETLGAHYFCLIGKAPKPVGSQNFERQEQDLAVSDSVDLHKSSSLFEVLAR